jgi:sigma-B regulation protein RsbU (phosphoserine phosphatase)
LRHTLSKKLCNYIVPPHGQRCETIVIEVSPMSSAPVPALETFRPQLLERRERLLAASASVSGEYLHALIQEIDGALQRIDTGAYGRCETCHDPIEPERLVQDPLARFCLDHLSPDELQAHQQDLDLAKQIQSQLLPPRRMALEAWDAYYRYEPVGAVGGDYCELILPEDGKSLFFATGDVAGKGVAASLLMTHLSAIFRSLLSLDLPLGEVMARANRLFCDSTAPAHYATMACGRATPHGVELCNAGHCPPLALRRRGGIERFDSTGLPLGLFCGVQYTVRNVTLNEGDTLVLFSDGVTEALSPEGSEYGEDRLVAALRDYADRDASSMATGVLRDLRSFCGARPPVDDMTLLVLRRRD